MDGLYFAIEFINFLDDSSLNFVIKAKTTTAVLYKEEKVQLRHCKDLHLNSNQNQKKIKESGMAKLIISSQSEGLANMVQKSSI